MTASDVQVLFKSGTFPNNEKAFEIIETHISWVILTENYAFKIKKPIAYSFLDFSSLAKRKYYCHNEVELNRRLATEMYICVVPIVSSHGRFFVSTDFNGNVFDYAVMMKRMDGGLQMDQLLQKDAVNTEDVKKIAEVLVEFHQKTEIIYHSNLSDLHHYFNDLLEEVPFLSKNLSEKAGSIIEICVSKADQFIRYHSVLIENRMKEGFVRDCHGDLHSRNIFLYDNPVIFDCIEFNPDIRHVDLLNELAFFCMDLEVFGHEQLSNEFISYYNHLFPIMRNKEEEKLFLFFKAYRANVRAKVNALRAKSTAKKEASEFLLECFKYLELMAKYIQQLG